MNQHHLHKLASYNLWANKRISEYIVNAGEHKADEVIESSFPGIRKTLYHLWDGQEIWMMRLNGKSANSWPSHHFTGTLADATLALVKNSEEYVRFAENITVQSAQEVLNYNAMDGSVFSNSLEDVLMHIMNHSTFHRGQLITMLRITGFTSVGSTDFIRFIREQ
ncbi:DinB family protein [soil metagenome]